MHIKRMGLERGQRRKKIAYVCMGWGGQRGKEYANLIDYACVETQKNTSQASFRVMHMGICMD